jgi:hypothetical protein
MPSLAAKRLKHCQMRWPIYKSLEGLELLTMPFASEPAMISCIRHESYCHHVAHAPAIRRKLTSTL